MAKNKYGKFQAKSNAVLLQPGQRPSVELPLPDEEKPVDIGNIASKTELAAREAQIKEEIEKSGIGIDPDNIPNIRFTLEKDLIAIIKPQVSQYYLTDSGARIKKTDVQIEKEKSQMKKLPGLIIASGIEAAEKGYTPGVFTQFRTWADDNITMAEINGVKVGILSHHDCLGTYDNGEELKNELRSIRAQSLKMKELAIQELAEVAAEKAKKEQEEKEKEILLEAEERAKIDAKIKELTGPPSE